MEKKTTKKAGATKKSPAKKKETMQASAEGTQASAPRKTKARAKKADAKSCSAQGCKREYRAKGYCNNHYRQWRHGKFAKARYKACHDYGCHKPMGLNRHGLCEDHYQNIYVKGLEATHAPAAPAAAPKKEEKTADTEAA